MLDGKKVELGQYWRATSDARRKGFPFIRCDGIFITKLWSNSVSGICEGNRYETVDNDDLYSKYELIEEPIWTFKDVSVIKFCDKYYTNVIDKEPTIMEIPVTC